MERAGKRTMSDTVSPLVPDSETLDSARTHLEKFLRRRDLKLTSQRMEILEAAASMGAHFTADDLIDSFRDKGARPGKATVYRTLSLLVEANILEGHDFQSFSSSVYEFSWGRSHHDHFICLSCGKIIEFFSQELEDLQDELAQDFDFAPIDHSLKIYGICSDCQKKGVGAADVRRY